MLIGCACMCLQRWDRQTEWEVPASIWCYGQKRLAQPAGTETGSRHRRREWEKKDQQRKPGRRRTRLFGCTASIALRCKGGVFRCSVPLMHWRQVKWRLRNRRRLMVPTEGLQHARMVGAVDTPVKGSVGEYKLPMVRGFSAISGRGAGVMQPTSPFPDGRDPDGEAHT